MGRVPRHRGTLGAVVWMRQQSGLSRRTQARMCKEVVQCKGKKREERGVNLDMKFLISWRRIPDFGFSWLERVH